MTGDNDPGLALFCAFSEPRRRSGRRDSRAATNLVSHGVWLLSLRFRPRSPCRIGNCVDVRDLFSRRRYRVSRRERIGTTDNKTDRRVFFYRADARHTDTADTENTRGHVRTTCFRDTICGNSTGLRGVRIVARKAFG